MRKFIVRLNWESPVITAETSTRALEKAKELYDEVESYFEVEELLDEKK